MSDYWVVGLLGCRTIGLSDYWVVGLLGCRTIGLSDYWVVGLLGCRTIGLLDYWAVGLLGCRTIGLLGLLGCPVLSDICSSCGAVKISFYGHFSKQRSLNGRLKLCTANTRAQHCAYFAPEHALQIMSCSLPITAKCYIYVYVRQYTLQFKGISPKTDVLLVIIQTMNARQ